MAQDSPPISPLLYQPGGGASATTCTAFPMAAHQLQIPSSALHYTTLAQQQQQRAMPTSMHEIWVPTKSEYAASVAGGVVGGAAAVSTGCSLAFEVSSTPVGYSCHPASMKVAQLQQQNIYTVSVPKIEQASSPAELHMDIQP